MHSLSHNHTKALRNRICYPWCLSAVLRKQKRLPSPGSLFNIVLKRLQFFNYQCACTAAAVADTRSADLCIVLFQYIQ